MKRIKVLLSVLLILALTIFTFSSIGDESNKPSASNVMQEVWDNLIPLILTTEIEKFRMTSTNWTSQEKYGTRWINYNNDKLMLVLNNSKTLKPKPDGVLIKPNNSLCGFSALVQKRKKIKSKNGSYGSKANGTEFNYIDISRFGGEKPDEFEYTISNMSINNAFQGMDVMYSIKAVKKTKIDDDYTYRIFHVVYLKDDKGGYVPCIKGIEYFSVNDQLCKIQINEHLQWNKDYSLWRADKITVSSIENNSITGETTFELMERELNKPFGSLNKTILKNGNVR